MTDTTTARDRKRIYTCNEKGAGRVSIRARFDGGVPDAGKTEARLTRPREGLGALGGLLEGDSLLLTHGGDDGDEEVLAIIEIGLNLLAELAVRELDVVLGGAVLGHEVEEAVVDVDLSRVERGLRSRARRGRQGVTYELEFVTEDVRDIHVVGRGGDILL